MKRWIYFILVLILSLICKDSFSVQEGDANMGNGTFNSNMGSDSNRVVDNDKILAAHYSSNNGTEKGYKFYIKDAPSDRVLDSVGRGSSATDNVMLTIDSKLLTPEVVSILDSLINKDEINRGISLIESSNEQNNLFRNNLIEIINSEVKKKEKTQSIEAMAYLLWLVIFIGSIFGIRYSHKHKNRLFESIFGLLLVASTIFIVNGMPNFVSFLNGYRSVF